MKRDPGRVIFPPGAKERHAQGLCAYCGKSNPRAKWVNSPYCCSPMCTKAMAATLIYGWAHLRRVTLDHHPDCVRCGARATEVDHIVPIALGGGEYDPANLQPLCRACHAAKTAQDLGAIAEARRLDAAQRHNHTLEEYDG